MIETQSASATIASTRASSVPWLLIGTIGALWLLAINQLRVEWSINAQYAYGWTVPFLALYLFFERWKDHPRPRACGGRPVLAFLVTLCAFMLLPLRIVQEANPDWRLVSWMLTSAVAALSLIALYFFGGRPWLRHLAFPIFFMFVAVPWPVPWENALIQRLMSSVATLCVDALGWCGIPAVQHGNIIEIGSGSVGVEEACSGVRSLQTTLMISLFLGELFRFAIWRRLVLIASGIAVAYLCNAGRSFFLVWISASRGTQAVAQWHDTAGLFVLAITIATLLWIARLLRKRGTPAAQADGIETRATLRQLPTAILVSFLTWLLLIEAGTELWYRLHEPKGESRRWTIDWPSGLPGFRDLSIPETARSILRYNEGRAAAWMSEEGMPWSTVFLRWEPGRSAAQLAKAHGPEICLPAGGATLQTDFGVQPMRIRDVTLPVHAYLFTMRGRPVQVFYCLAEDGAINDPHASSYRRMTLSTRLEAVRAGKRNRGQQILEVAIFDEADARAAERAFQRGLEQIIR